MLKFRNLVIERLLDKLREIYIGNFNKKLVFENLDEIKFKTIAKTIKLSIKLNTKDEYVEILNADNRIYYGKNNNYLNSGDYTPLILNIDNTKDIIIKAVNISHFNCSNNSIKKLDLSKAKHLSWLECNNNLLMDLDFSNNSYIYNINCANNKQLLNIDFGGIKPGTVFLHCSNTGISTLKLNNLPNLQVVSCFDCSNLSNIDISENKELTLLVCDNCSLSNLSIYNNKKLYNLSCSNNKIESLDIKNNSNLVFLNCGKNKLTTLDVSNNFKIIRIDCYNNLFDSNALISLLNQLLKIESGKNKYFSINRNTHSNLTSPKELVNAISKLEEKGWKMFYM